MATEYRNRWGALRLLFRRRHVHGVIPSDRVAVALANALTPAERRDLRDWAGPRGASYIMPALRTEAD